MCPNCQKADLHITRFSINPNILKFDPQNVWFGWKCKTCSYMQEFHFNKT